MLSRLRTAFLEVLVFHPTPRSYWIQDDPQFTSCQSGFYYYYFFFKSETT